MQPTPPSARRGRPRKVAAADPDTRQALIRAGIAMLTEQGFTASGIDGILKAVGVPKGSFYYYFPSKAAFGQAIVAGYGDYFTARLARCLTQSDLTPLARLQVFIEQSAAGMAKYDFRRGCLVGNLGQEIAVLPAGYCQQLSAILHGWQRQVADCLRLAQAAGRFISRRIARRWRNFSGSAGKGRSCAPGWRAIASLSIVSPKGFWPVCRAKFQGVASGDVAHVQGASMFNAIVIEKDDAGYRAGLTPLRMRNYRRGMCWCGWITPL
ncbi:hypothetical protein SODG_002403 [Sodalis praecaptivus]